ncbi:MAG: nuclease [Chlorogloeopsis fritschii C42_A2020_084]|nr:nuclease [Chlorogloeopsis fritschii]MBF2008878.1 nuclease [Chlorogloeopsis fritschii C42_A2020_084]
MVTNFKRSLQSTACAQWLQTLISGDHRIIVPEIADYEVRRELLRANRVKGIARLDTLIEFLEYLPITTATMRQAAIFWAQARQQGKPTADDKAIDGDMILAAQAVTLCVSNVVIATTNVGHLSRFVPADLWQNIAGN